MFGCIVPTLMLLLLLPLLLFSGGSFGAGVVFRFAAVSVRLYSGWSYVSTRLDAEVVEYEESGPFMFFDLSSEYSARTPFPCGGQVRRPRGFESIPPLVRVCVCLRHICRSWGAGFGRVDVIEY